jgi:hypothetical protein
MERIGIRRGKGDDPGVESRDDGTQGEEVAPCAGGGRDYKLRHIDILLAGGGKRPLSRRLSLAVSFALAL